MPRVIDVAKYILDKQGPMTTMKLQKLVYYTQAWSLVWDERPLFSESVEAWKNGPVVPELYTSHRGKFEVSAQEIAGTPGVIDQDGRETIDAVLDYYGKHNAQYLSDLTHLEDPWKLARQEHPADANANTVITHASMAEYYAGLDQIPGNG